MSIERGPKAESRARIKIKVFIDELLAERPPFVMEGKR
jgi:hypothetical protein